MAYLGAERQQVCIAKLGGLERGEYTNSLIDIDKPSQGREGGALGGQARYIISSIIGGEHDT